MKIRAQHILQGLLFMVVCATILLSARFMVHAASIPADAKSRRPHELMSITFDAAKYTYTGNEIRPSLTVKDVKGEVVPSHLYQVSYENNILAGKATVTVTAHNARYAGRVTKNFTIIPPSTALSTADIGHNYITLAWKSLDHGVSGYQLQLSKYSDFRKSGRKSATVMGRNVTQYAFSKLSVSTEYYARVRSYWINKEGVKLFSNWSKAKKYTILPPAVSLENPSAGTDTVTLKWKTATKGVDGYQLQLAKSDDFAKAGRISQTISKASTSEFQFTKLAAGTNYYGRIRSYFVNSKGAKVYSDWSDTKNATTKNPNHKVVYLTFDDGPSPYTEKLLNILDRYNVKATFFVTGGSAEYRSYVKESYKRGHTIGLHTWTHAYLDIYRSADAYYKDLNKISDYVYEQTGYRAKYIRFPGGSSNSTSKNACAGIMSFLTKDVLAKGYQYYDWNVSSQDAVGGYISREEVFRNVINGIKSHDVSMVLQHDINSNSVDAVADILDWGIRNGYTFLPISDATVPVHHSVAN